MLLPQQPSTDPGGEGAGRSPVLGALRFRIGHVAGGALGGQGRGFWAAPAQPLHPICQGVLYWADFRGEQLIVLEGTGDRKSLGTRRCGFYLFGSEERGLDAGQGVKASGRAEPWRGQSEAAEDTTQGTEVMLRGRALEMERHRPHHAPSAAAAPASRARAGAVTEGVKAQNPAYRVSDQHHLDERVAPSGGPDRRWRTPQQAPRSPEHPSS